MKADRHLRREQDCKAELVERIADMLCEDGVREALPGVHMARASRPSEPIHCMYPAALCVIVQGEKEVFIGNSVHRYDVNRYLLATIQLPAVSRIVHASIREPYLSLRVNLEPALVGSVIAEAGFVSEQATSTTNAVAVSTQDSDLLESCLRLVRCIRDPGEARFIAPLLKREIVFRLLVAEQGSRLRYLPALSGGSYAITMAIERLRSNFDQPLSIDALARELGMSPSAFHHQFRSITDQSPLQFQKQLRLLEARRLMLAEDMDAATAGYRVGYADASHFSRDYKKLFGLPPARDAERLKETVSSPKP